jgi:serine O-acetyltransferase
VILSLTESGLAGYLTRQINNMFPDGRHIDVSDVLTLLPAVLERVDHCFSQVGNKYFFDGRDVVFNHLHGDQYAMFLYLVSREVYELKGDTNLASKLFLLNKALHGIDVFYEVELPSIFLFVHPLGTVLGRGSYSDYLLVYQCCSVGSNHDAYPTLGEYCTLRPGSAILGECMIGRNCTLAAQSLLVDDNLDSDTVYFGTPKLSSKRNQPEIASIWRREGNAQR